MNVATSAPVASTYTGGQDTVFPLRPRGYSDSGSSTSAQTAKHGRGMLQPAAPAANGSRYAYTDQSMNRESHGGPSANGESHHAPFPTQPAPNGSINPYTGWRMNGESSHRPSPAQPATTGFINAYTRRHMNGESSHAPSPGQPASTGSTYKNSGASKNDDSHDSLSPQSLLHPGPSGAVNSSTGASVEGNHRDTRMEVVSLVER